MLKAGNGEHQLQSYHGQLRLKPDSSDEGVVDILGLRAGLNDHSLLWQKPFLMIHSLRSKGIGPPTRDCTGALALGNFYQRCLFISK